MNLLPIGNQLTTVINFQKDLTQMNSKLDGIDQRIVTANDGHIQIDNKCWQQAYKNLANALESNEHQLSEVLNFQR